MKAILFETVGSLGRPGDIVEVKPGYFRNFLFPRGLADAATRSNLKRLEAKMKVLEKRASEELEAAKIKAGDLEGLELEFHLRASDKDHLYGSVGVSDISQALEAKEVEIERRNIIMKTAIKMLGEHEVGLRLHPSVVVDIKVIVHKAEE